MNHDPSLQDTAPVAAIDHDGRSDVDSLMQAFVAQQRSVGRSVLGLLMVPRDPAAGCRTAMVLADIDSGEEYLVSQDLGAESQGCAADPQGFARASRVLRDALERQPDLVVCNRFGALEAENGGFVAELLALLERGIPVLTAVAPKYADAWQRFIGEAPLLPADPAALTVWFDAVMQQRHASDASAGSG
jgi:nucleoside-triphosphatase THEP1